MQTFALFSVVAMLCVTVAVGSRLLVMARHTRQLPELLFGAAFLASGVGLGGGQLGDQFVWTSTGTFATVMSTLLFGVVVAGVVALHGAIWRVFRPHDIYGFLSFAGGSGLALIAYGFRIGAGDFAGRVSDGPGNQLLVTAVISVLTWAGIEAIHLYLRLRKQIALGLAEPVAASQIGLWGVATTLSAVMVLVVSYNLLSLQRSPMEDAFSTLVLLVSVFGASGAMWCAFFPPRALREKLVAAHR